MYKEKLVEPALFPEQAEEIILSSLQNMRRICIHIFNILIVNNLYSPGARRVLFMFCLPKGCLVS